MLVLVMGFLDAEPASSVALRLTAGVAIAGRVRGKAQTKAGNWGGNWEDKQSEVKTPSWQNALWNLIDWDVTRAYRAEPEVQSCGKLRFDGHPMPSLTRSRLDDIATTIS